VGDSVSRLLGIALQGFLAYGEAENINASREIEKDAEIAEKQHC
jgi:hypothetical protein